MLDGEAVAGDDSEGIQAVIEARHGAESQRLLAMITQATVSDGAANRV